MAIQILFFFFAACAGGSALVLAAVNLAMLVGVIVVMDRGRTLSGSGRTIEDRVRARQTAKMRAVRIPRNPAATPQR